jgi:hypothetical protein
VIPLITYKKLKEKKKKKRLTETFKKSGRNNKNNV